MAFGRPILYADDLPQKLFEHMKNGFSFESFGGVIGTGRSCLYDWVKKYPDFSDAKSAGQAASQLFWEEKGQKGIDAEKFQSSLYIFTMKARFQWADQLVVKDKNDDEETEREKIRKMPMKDLVKVIRENLPEEE